MVLSLDHICDDVLSTCIVLDKVDTPRDFVSLTSTSKGFRTRFMRPDFLTRWLTTHVCKPDSLLYVSAFWGLSGIVDHALRKNVDMAVVSNSFREMHSYMRRPIVVDRSTMMGFNVESVLRKHVAADPEKKAKTLDSVISYDATTDENHKSLLRFYVLDMAILLGDVAFLRVLLSVDTWMIRAISYDNNRVNNYLFSAFRSRHLRPDIVRLLVEKGVNPWCGGEIGQVRALAYNTQQDAETKAAALDVILPLCPPENTVSTADTTDMTRCYTRTSVLRELFFAACINGEIAFARELSARASPRSSVLSRHNVGDVCKAFLDVQSKRTFVTMIVDFSERDTGEVTAESLLCEGIRALCACYYSYPGLEPPDDPSLLSFLIFDMGHARSLLPFTMRNGSHLRMQARTHGLLRIEEWLYNAWNTS